MQLTQYFCWRNTCVLFTLGNRGISGYATQATYAAFLLEHLHLLYFRKQVHILLCHPWNLCGMSKKSSGQYPTCVCVYIYIYIYMYIYICVCMCECIWVYYMYVCACVNVYEYIICMCVYECYVYIRKERSVLSYLATPPLGQDMTQGQFLSGV